MGAFVYIPIQAEQSLATNPSTQEVQVINETTGMDDTGIGKAPDPETVRIDREKPKLNMEEILAKHNKKDEDEVPS